MANLELTQQQALELALEMLRNIRNGGTYPAIEYCENLFAIEDAAQRVTVDHSAKLAESLETVKSVVLLPSGNRDRKLAAISSADAALNAWKATK